MESGLTVDKLGIQRWRDENGELHREDGPAAILPDGEKWWCQNGILHRENGPAVIDSNGKSQWWLNNRWYTFTEWANELNFDSKQRLEMVMKWGD